MEKVFLADKLLEPRVMMNILQRLLCAALFTSSLAMARGGNSDGGTDPEKVTAGAVRLLIEQEGLKRAMINYIQSLPVDQVEDGFVRENLKQMIRGGLLNDIKNSHYVIATRDSRCHDAYDRTVAASTKVGGLGENICFDVDRLGEAFRNLGEEDMMIQLASVAFHEHVHHFQEFSREKIQLNEDGANRIAGYVLITAKFVQLPLLRWTRPESGPEDLQVLQSLHRELKAKEEAFLAPAAADYADYPGYRGQSDRGLVKLLPRSDFQNKLMIQGGGAYYSFARLDHAYGFGSDIELEGGSEYGKTYLMAGGFGGYAFGLMAKVGQVPLESVTLDHPGLKFLLELKPAQSAAEIRQQQSQQQMNANGFEYRRELGRFRVGDTIVLRAIDFEQSDLLVVFRIVRIGKDSSVTLAWKILKRLPAPRNPPRLDF